MAQFPGDYRRFNSVISNRIPAGLARSFLVESVQGYKPGIMQYRRADVATSFLHVRARIPRNAVIPTPVNQSVLDFGG